MFLSVYAQECRVKKGDIDDEGSVVKVDIEEENGERKQENERRIPCNFMNSVPSDQRMAFKLKNR